ncbi:MAG: deoxyribonuclease IV [Candidatus Eisenbacteria bacterium]
MLGAHFSTAGGLHTALERAATLRCRAVQIFTHNRAQWRIRPLAAEESDRFHRAVAEHGPFSLAAHSSYLINLASPDRGLRERSIRTLGAELLHCSALGIPLLVLHPGAHMGAGERAGIERVARAIQRVTARIAGQLGAQAPRLVLESTAGQGSSLGWRFEQLAAILGRLAAAAEVRVCIDTAHAFAAGYDFRTPGGYARLWSEFDRVIGADRLAILHLNDSRVPCGSRVDRHAHIGQGEIGRQPFAWILNDPRFAALPKVIETPKEGEMDRKNIALLRRLARTGARANLPTSSCS